MTMKPRRKPDRAVCVGDVSFGRWIATRAYVREVRDALGITDDELAARVADFVVAELAIGSDAL